MATLMYDLGTPLGPDSRAVADLQAIDDYVRTVARPKIQQYPKSQAVIEDYERWRQAVSWWDMNIMVNDTMRFAKNKRDAINKAQGNVLPPWASVEEGAFVESPPEPEQPTKLPSVGFFVGLAVVTGTVYLLWRYLPKSSSRQALQA